jgi:hypothetical protein
MTDSQVLLAGWFVLAAHGARLTGVSANSSSD